MSLLSDEEMDTLFKAHYDKNQCVDTLLVAFEAAIMEKLASAELPKNGHYDFDNFVPLYTADQLTAWGNTRFAQGAASQLSAEPAWYAYRVNNCGWQCVPTSYVPHEDAYDKGTLSPLFAAPKALEPLTEPERKKMWHGTFEAHSRWSAYEWFSHGIQRAEKHHGITKGTP